MAYSTYLKSYLTLKVHASHSLDKDLQNVDAAAKLSAVKAEQVQFPKAWNELLS